MNNQHSVIALDWLNPVLQTVFSDLNQMLAKPKSDTDVELIADKLHQVTGALRLIEQPKLSQLSAVMESVCEAIEKGDLSEKHYTDVQQGVSFLQYELQQLQQTRQLHEEWVKNRTFFFNALLGEPVEITQTFLDQIDLPAATAMIASNAMDTADLLKIWRFNTLQLLETNTNQTQYLQALASVASHLAALPSEKADKNYRKVWQITAEWLTALIQNDQPLPHQYAYVLNELDTAIQNPDLPALSLVNLAVDVLLQTLPLTQNSEQLQQLVTPLKLTPVDNNTNMFRQVLAKLEQAIYQIATPDSVLPLLQDIETLLRHRGWQFYESSLGQIINDVQMMIADPSSADTMGWQVERQLQDLYSQLMQTTETLETQIGMSQFAYAKNPQQEAVRQTRIHLENIKLAFNNYVQTRNIDNLKVNDELIALAQVFEILGLEQPKILAEQMRVLFGQMTSHALHTISWETSDTLAEMIAQFELFLDYLSHQNVNDDFLEKTQALLQRASTLIAEQIHAPLDASQLISRKKHYTTKTAVYDDKGESIVEADADTSFDTATHAEQQFSTASEVAVATNPIIPEPPTPAQVIAVSEELQHARSLLKPDSDSMDEDIREIFIEEAEEVLGDMTENVAAWQADITDTAALKEIRRGFHTLKGSGRMVGAFQVGEAAWAVENMLNRVLEDSISATPEMAGFISETHQLLPQLVADFAAARSPSIDPAIIILKANNLIQQRPLLQGVPASTVAVQTPVIQPPAAPTINIAPTVITSAIDSPVEATSHPVMEEVSTPISSSTVEPQSPVEIESPQSPTHQATTTFATDTLATNTLVADQPATSTATGTGTATPNFAELPANIQAEMDSLEWKADDILDEDIQEIYVEEAEEVLEEITPLYHVWQANIDDVATFKDIRRGFHTLKGSGRMVGANQLGELGWSIENMLNRVLDNTIEVDAGMLALIGDVLNVFPSLVETFAQSRDDYPESIRVWAAVANLYSKKQGDNLDYLAIRKNILHLDGNETQTVAAPVLPLEDAQQDNFEIIHPTASQPTASATMPVENEDELRFSDDGEIRFSDEGEIRFSDDSELLEDDNKLPEAKVKEFTPLIRDMPTTTEANPVVSVTDSNPAPTHTSPTIQTFSDEDVIGQVFLEESQELLEKIDKFIADNQDKSAIDIPDELVRIFHTLRGGAALSNLPRVKVLSEALESGLDTFIRQEKSLTTDKLEIFATIRQLLAGYIDNYRHQESVSVELEDEATNHQLIEALFSQIDQADDEIVQHPMSVTQLLELGIDTLLEADTEFLTKVHPLANREANEADLADSQTPVDAQSEIVNTEPPEVNSQPNDLKNYLTTLHEQSKILDEAVGDSKFAPLAHALKNAYRYLQRYPVLAQDTEISQALLQTHAQLTNVFDEIAAGLNVYWDETPSHQLGAILAQKVHQIQLEQTEYETVVNDDDLVEIFLAEIIAIDEGVTQNFNQWQNNLANTQAIQELQRYSNALAGGARLVGIRSIHLLAEATRNIYTAILNGTLTSSTDLVDVMQQVYDTISIQVQSILQYSQSFYANELVEQLNSLATTGIIPSDILLSVPVLVQDTKAEEIKQQAAPITQALDTPKNNLEYSQEVINNFEQRRLATWHGQEPDEDILQIYLEEAKELIDSSSQNLQEFRANTNNLAALQALQRELHTIKGGARMVGAEGLATLAHEMETIYEDLGSRRKPATRIIGDLLAACHDWLASAIFVLENKYNPELPEALLAALLQFTKSPDSLKAVPQASLASQIEQIEIYQSSLNAKQDSTQRDISVMPLQAGNFGEAQEQNTQTAEMIRVPAGLMEKMINLSGESAINRARIDMGVTSITNTIEEMGMTVQRLADQLRRMETELEVQILSQIDENLLQDVEFDPLEMDQYSSLNQLSKSLSESASDLLDIKTTMLDKTRDTENLLLQLSRTQLELQEGLMTSRIVPFSRITPRLQRIVRQTATELNKMVELRILNDEGDIDRNILERITSPLEHMLRNAVDHGIERTQERIENGKSRTGLITLEIEREGDEIVVYLTDDGKGINVDAVRKKAVEQGLIAEDDTSLSRVDIMQYIFNAGLSTSTAVTQLSGRGVGMDVVQSEIKQLGGVVSVDSETGKGSRFVMRLPLTVAVSDALVVKAGDKNFAVPLVQIERVVRINAETVYQFYDSAASTIAIDSEDYRLRYLNQILYNTDPRESLRNQTASVPVIIIRSETGQRLALQVDALAGSRVEVVVKPLGKQLSHISGISAATIMGDGSVMLILDLNALMRNAIYTTLSNSTAKTQTRASKPVVLIIDDSVTVRKVTSRLLERHGYETQVAKDGIDAIEKLQELTPDIMLLDIEMPRMDGFEVATQVRHNNRLKQVPIIMITSRTGEKHRERALSIGVNEYMGKPFQEEELVATISQLLAARGVTQS